MSDKRISDLVELSALAADDVLPVVDADANATKRITGANLTTAVRGDTGTLTLGDGTAISSLGADSFRLTASATSDGKLTAWERVDETTSTTLGSGVTESGGDFTVPNNGVWLIAWEVTIESRDDTGNGNVFADLFVDGEIVGRIQNFQPDDGNGRMRYHGASFFLGGFETTTPVYIALDNANSGEVILGSATRTETGITFVRLGDA